MESMQPCEQTVQQNNSAKSAFKGPIKGIVYCIAISSAKDF